MEALHPPNEASRLEALRRYAILDTPAEPAFDDLTFLAAHICGTPIALVSLVNANRQWFKSKVGLTISETPRDVSFCAHAILQSDLLVVQNTLDDERFATNPLVIGTLKIRFYAGAPLETADGHRLGTLCVIDYVPRDLSPAQRQALHALSRQVVMQLELRRKLADLARTTSEVAERRQAQDVAEAMVHIVQELVGSVTTAQVTDRIVASVVGLLRGRRAVLFRVDRTSGVLVCVAMAGEGDREKWIGRTLAAGEGVAGRAVMEDRAIWTSNHFDDRRITSPEWLRERYREDGFGAVIALPLKAHAEIIGALALVDMPGRIFTDTESRVLTTFTDLAALALGNAQLYEESAARRRRLASMVGVARKLTSRLDLSSVLKTVSEAASEIFEAEVGFRLVEGDELVRFGATPGAREVMVRERLKLGESISGRVAQTGEPIVTADTAADTRAIPEHQKAHRTGQTAALMCVPIRGNARVLGTLNIYRERGRRFNDDDLDLAMSLAAQAGVALENARLYEDRATRLHVIEALLDIAQATSSVLELKPVLKIVAQRAAQVIGAARCSISLWQEEHLVPVMSQFADGHVDAALWAKYKAIGSHRLEDMPLTAEAIRTQRPVIIEDMLNTTLLTPHWRGVYGTFGPRAALIVPLLRQGKVVGTLSLDQTEGPYAWNQTQIDLAMTIANHAALVTENARLYEDAQRRLGQATALLEMANVLNSTIELKSLLKNIAQRTAQAVGVDRCSIFLCQADGTLRAVMSQFADGHPDLELWTGFKTISQRRAEEIKALSEAIRLAQPVLIEDAVTSELVPDWWVEMFAIKNMVVVPLIQKDIAVGVLHLSNTVAKRPIGEDQIALARTIATQVALVIDNARLYDQVRGQLQQLRETQAQLLQAGKLAAVGQLVAGVAHELNNPLAIVMGQANLLKFKSPDPLVADKAEKILRGAARAARIVKELQTFARPHPAQLTAVQLTDVLGRVVALRQETCRVSGILVEKEISPGVPPVWADAQQLEQVVLNLLLNAEQALAKSVDRPRVMLRLTAGTGVVRLTVSDTGPGIAPEILPRIFEPFFTTRPVGQGTGLGLAISYGIVQAHRGRIWAESAPGQGATFIVEFPAHTVDPGPDAAPAAGAPRADLRRGHVLVIDDEEDVAEVLCGMFELLKQEVTVALGGIRGWERLATPGAEYDLVTLDLKMPDLSGPKLWERLVAAGSPLADRVAFITGDSVDGETQRFLKQTGRPVLHKPFDLADLAVLISR